MTNEEIYDAEMAPVLLKLGQRCQELGMPFVAQVEWDRGETGRGMTLYCPRTDLAETRPSAAHLLVYYAARCNGNVDTMLSAVMKSARQYGHTSACLSILGVPTKPVAEEDKEIVS